jgi:hypothetical protein
MSVFDEIEVQIVADCVARGVNWEVPLMRYVIERDTERAQREWAEHFARFPLNTESAPST